MIRTTLIKWLGLSALACLAPFAAIAQTANDLERAVTAGAQFEETQQLLDEAQGDATLGGMIDGEAGVFILKKNEIFQLGAAIGAGYTDNPGRTLDTNAEDANFASLALTAGVNTRVAQKYDAGINVVVSGTEYDRSDAPSYRSAITNAYIGTPVLDGRVYISGNVSAGVSADKDFDDTTGFYSAGFNASTVHRITENIIVRPSLGIAQTWSEQEEQNNLAITALAQVVWQPADKWLVQGDISYSHRVYDDFFEDVTFVERKDDVIRAGIGVSRQLNDYVSLNANLDYTSQDSEFFISEYDAIDAGLNLRVSKRF